MNGSLRKQAWSDIHFEEGGCEVSCRMPLSIKEIGLHDGAVDMVLLMMESFTDTEYVQSYGCSLLSNLILEVDAEHLPTLLSEGKPSAIHSVLRAMKTFPRAADLQAAGCKFLSLVADFSLPNQHVLKEMATSHGALTILSSAIENHANDDYEEGRVIQECGRRALRWLLVW